MAKNRRIRLKGKVHSFLLASFWLGIAMIAVNVLIYTFSREAGLVLTAFAAVYFLVLFLLYFNSRAIIMNELISFATEYGQIQKTLLRQLDLPSALLDETGRIVWTNLAFERTVHKDAGFSKSITSLFPSVTADKLPVAGDELDEVQMNVEYGEQSFSLQMKRIDLSEMARNSDIIDENGYEGGLIAVYLFDETALKLALQEIDDQSLAAGLIYLDNYDEALESVEEVRRSLLIALIDRKVNKYVASAGGIAKKIEKDKYFLVMPKRSCVALCDSRFEILEDVKTVNIGNEMAVTLSVGMGLDGLSYAQNYEFARSAIDLALGRGGDQAVVRTSDATYYYGGKSQQVEKNTRVKARVKAHALEEIIAGKDNVLVMGHRQGDADSFGSAVGIYRIARSLDHQAQIVVNEMTSSIRPLFELFRDNPDYESDMIVDSARAIDAVGPETVLVVVDVNKPSITECPELLRLCKYIVVFDHHRQGTEVIENATLSYVEPYASSACEMVSELLQYIEGDVRIHAEEADSMYAGIMIDTNNFSSKTGVRTFEAAAFLRRNGADVTRVKKLFREDALEYKARADAVSQAEIYRGSFAISICDPDGEVESPTIIGAQAANELLNIRGIRASFVCTPWQGKIYVSARSIDEVNVQVIMEQFGGGGHMNEAGCQMEGVSATEAVGILRDALDKSIEEGTL
ncbi:MAG: DHH family phosphoesterase [Lachnospiraceae bacterium]|nr:DHH family phosphoesterase [Lachnospiraceae bacterium]